MRVKEKTIYSFNSIKALSLLESRETEEIISQLSKLNRETLFTYPNKDLGFKTFKKFKKLEKKRLKNWPLPYLLSYQDFFGLRFQVSPAVLIPRPETEILVEKIISEVSRDNNKRLFIDIGCGSGSIIISLAKNLSKNNIFIASDVSCQALKIAKKNIKKHELKDIIVLKKTNLLRSHEKSIISSWERGEEVVITANLPYLNEAEMKELSIQREPKLALYSKEDGLSHYKILFKQLSLIINRAGTVKKANTLVLIIEINPQQLRLLIKELNNTLPSSSLEKLKDLRDKDRFILIRV